MKLSRLVVLLVATIGVLTPYASADAPSVKSLEDQITKLVADNPPPASDDSMLKLNDLKVSLIAAIDGSIKQLTTDMAKVTGESQDALQIVIDKRKTERKSVSLSLGKWETGLSTSVATSQGQAIGQGQQTTSGTTGTCAITSDPTSKKDDTTIYSYSVKCDASAAPTTLSVMLTPPAKVPVDPDTKDVRFSGYNSDKSVVSFAFPPSTRSGSFTLSVPTAQSQGATATYYFAYGQTDIQTCLKTPTASGCSSAVIPFPSTPADSLAAAGVDATKGNTLFTKATAGVMMTGATGSTPQSKLYVDFYLSAPLFWTSKVKVDCSKLNPSDCSFKQFQAKLDRQFRDPLDTRVWAYFHPQITSIPQPNLALGQVATVSASVLQSVTSTNVTNLVQALQFDQGLEVRLMKHGPAMPDPIGEIKATSSKSSVGLFAFGSFGVGVPITGQSNLTTIYNVNDSLLKLYPPPPNVVSPKYVALTEDSINRFYKDYYVGLRLKTFNYAMVSCLNNPTYFCPRVKNEFPGIFDVAWGEDESINPWTLKGPGVIRIQGDYPLPFYPALHLFGQLYLSLEKRTITDPAQYVVAAGDVTLSTTGVYQVGVIPASRDQYRFGIGLDLIEAIKRINQAKITISPIVPAGPTIKAGDKATQFKASVSGSGDVTINWAVADAKGGSEDVGKIDTNGNYTPPGKIDDTIQVKITAAAHSDPTKTSTTVATVSKADAVAAKPDAPAKLSADTAGTGEAALSWMPVSGATYDVSRGISAGTEKPVAAATGLKTTSFKDSGLTSGTIYFYVVTAKNAAGTESDRSNEVSVTPR